MEPTCVPNGIITFPMLGDGFAITTPSSFTLFNIITIHWYGVIIAAGFLLAYIYANRRCRQFGLTEDNIIDMLIIGAPAGIIGARLYYVIFNYSQYQGNFWGVFKIWEGGLAIYGGIIGAIIAVSIYAKAKKIRFGAFLDIGGLGLLIGQTVGRWGNFMNREAFGGATDVFCRMGLTDAAGTTYYVHPTFLYESVWNLLGLLILHIFSKEGKRRYDGQLFVMYLAWYGLGRFFIEGLRTDSLYIGNTGIRVSQLLAGITVVVGIIILVVNSRIKHDPAKLQVNILKRGEAEVSDENENS